MKKKKKNLANGVTPCYSHIYIEQRNPSLQIICELYRLFPLHFPSASYEYDTSPQILLYIMFWQNKQDLYWISLEFFRKAPFSSTCNKD